MQQTPYNGPGLYDAYLKWATNSREALRRLISQESLEALVETRDYWALVGANPVALGNQLQNMVNVELTRAREMLLSAATGLRKEVLRWAGVNRCLLMPDTNIYLHGGCRSTT